VAISKHANAELLYSIFCKSAITAKNSSPPIRAKLPSSR
jgi:hypothetical protein